MLKESFVFMFISSFMALFPVANPVGTGFIINGFLSGLDRSERRSIVRRIAVNYLLIGIGSLAIGALRTVPVRTVAAYRSTGRRSFDL